MYKLHLGRAVPTAAMAVFLGVSSLAPCAAFADDAVVYGSRKVGRVPASAVAEIIGVDPSGAHDAQGE